VHLPRSPSRSLSFFVGFGVRDTAVAEGKDDAQGAYEHFSASTRVSELEGRFLRGYEVHTAAAQFPGTPAKGLDMVKSYYNFRQAANRPIEAHASVQFPSLAEKNAGVYAVFRERGNIE